MNLMRLIHPTLSQPAASHDRNPTALRACLLAMLIACGGQARAGEAVSITRVRVGFAGHFRVGFWTPVEVKLQGGDKPLEGKLALSAVDGDGLRCETLSRPFKIPAAAEVRVHACAKFGGARGNLTISLVAGEAVLTARTITADADGKDEDEDVEFHVGFASTEGMIVSLGEPIGLEEALPRQRDRAERTNLVSLAGTEHLPEQWIGYEGVDQLVIGPSASGLDAALAGSPRLAALEHWLSAGGQLVLALGPDSERVLGGDQPLSRFLPGTLAGMANLTRTTSLEVYGGTYGGAPLRFSRGTRHALPAARLADVRGRAVLSEGDFPLIVRAPYTFGEVTFAAMDFSRPPLAEWPGRGLAIRRLLGERTKGEHEETEYAAPSAAHLGLVDLSGQLRATLDQFRGVNLAPFWAVAALAVVYIALVGPLDFLLLKTVFRRMEWTWITFPLIVVLFCGGAVWAAYRLKGDRLLLNQVDLVDIDLASGRVRGTSWFNLFSPATTTYDLSLRSQVPGQNDRQGNESVLSWQGLPGNVLGGMEQQVSAPSGVARSYRISAESGTIEDVPIPIWSSKSFVGRWQTTAAAGIEAKLKAGRDEVVEGTVTNRLGQPLKDCLLVSGRWAWQFAELPPGVPVSVQAGEQRDLFALLKDFKYIREGDRDTPIQVATPYDQTSFNARSILQQMMFYSGVNGRGYTGLLNRYQAFVDLSDHLDMGQVILWGAADRAAAEVLSDGAAIAAANKDQTTFYRFLISVH